MNELEKTKYKLIDKSILALNEAIKSIDLFDMLGATEMYNTVLLAFESLQVKRDGYEEDDVIEKYLEELEEEHKKIIGIFEGGSLENLSSIIKEEILQRYKAMKEQYEEREFLTKNNIDVNNKVYKTYKKAGFLEDIDQETIDEISSYWEKHYDRPVDPFTSLAFYNFTGKLEPRIIDQIELNTTILPMLNDLSITKFYSDKNVYDLLIESEHAPENVLKRVRGQYFNSKNETISRGDAFKIFYEMKEDLIVKRSLSDDGEGVEKIRYRSHAFYLDDEKVDLIYIEDNWGDDFIIQRVLKQHPIMAAPHKYSINTFRMVTLRWNNKINYLMTYGRFGTRKMIKDNGGQGGVIVGISPEGKFNDWGMDHQGNIYKEHPTTGFKFKDFEKVPNFDEYIGFVKKLHNRILHRDYVSWDIVMGVDGKPIFIEMNFRGPVGLYQLISQKPIFGDYTEDIVAKALERRQRIEEHQRIEQEKRETQAKAIEEAKRDKEEEKEASKS